VRPDATEPAHTGSDEPGDLGAYCRAIETYLCKRNDGHLVRIVGPAFDCVSAWAARGVPLRVACRGIDRCVERIEAKGPRRRPVRVEFCDADVLDVFDEWRRAVGVPAAAYDDGTGADEGHGRRHASLAAHLDRVIARLTLLRGSGTFALGEAVDPLVTELDAARAHAKGLRGDARRQLLERLRALDAGLVAAVRARVDPQALAALDAEAVSELRAFRDRMPVEAFAAARAACVDRLIRDRYSLPTISLE
jgi:hypothetical protein